jgi:hypothetical protein
LRSFYNAIPETVKDAIIRNYKLSTEDDYVIRKQNLKITTIKSLVLFVTKLRNITKTKVTTINK